MWDIGIYVLLPRICVVGISLEGIAFVDTYRHLGEEFGNGVFLEGEDAAAAEEALEDSELKVITHG
jgi:hypothetical protein